MSSQRVVFITGASRGIGRALTEKFLKEAYEVIGTSTSGKAPYTHNNLHLLELDLSSPKKIQQCITDFLKMDKKIDILINNAGVWSGHDEDSTMYMDALRKTLEVNLIGTIDLTEKLLAHIRDSGKIINISSRAGSLNHVSHKEFDAYYPDYKISKAALNMYTVTLAKRTKDRKILVASIHPGWVETDMGGRGADLKPEEAAEEVYKRIISLKETGQFWFKQDKFPW